MSLPRTILATLAICTLAACSRTSVRENRFTFAFPDAEGAMVTHDDPRFEGKVVLVDIWGAWCPGCHLQQPHLVRWYETYAASGLEIVAIDFEMLLPDTGEERAERLRRYAKENGIAYTMLDGGYLQDAETALNDLRNIGGYPITIFIGRDGVVRAVEAGFADGDEVRQEELIRKLLAETP